METIPPLAEPVPPQPFSARRALAVLAALLGGFFLLLSLCGVAAYIGVPLRGTDVIPTNTLVASLTAIGFVFGLLVLLFALAALGIRPLPRLALPPAWLFVVIFVLVVAAGQWVLWANLAAGYLFPPWHVLASAMLPLAVLAYALRRLPPAPASGMLAQMSWGGLGTLLPAAVLELIIGFFVGAAALVLILLLVGVDRLQQLTARLSFVVTGEPDLAQILPVLASEPRLLIIVAAAALLLLSVVVPLVEETLKALAAAIAIWRYRPAAGQALLWGLAAGAGYAFSENLVNASGSVPTAAGSACLWAPVIVVRAGTSLVHMAATATVTLGWFNWFVLGRRAGALPYFLGAMAAHGFWNLIAILLGSALSNLNICQDPGRVFAGSSGLASAGALLIVAVLLGLAGLWIVALVRWARSQGSAPPEIVPAQS
ncbi:MAG: PrsW family glutamic-type intramembrane protease [Rudaea sp.]